MVRTRPGPGQLGGQGRGRNGQAPPNYRTIPDQNPANLPNPGVIAPRPEPPLVPIVRRPEPPPVPIDLREIASEASILLEIFSRAEIPDDGDIQDEHRLLIDNASSIILKIQKNLQEIDTRKGKNIATPEPPISKTDDTGVEIGCIICFSHIADVLLLPCKHLVLCMVCVLFADSPINIIYAMPTNVLVVLQRYGDKGEYYTIRS